MINQQALGVASYGTLMDWDLRPFFPAPLAFSFPLFLPLALPLPWGCDAASRLSEKNLPHQSCLSEKKWNTGWFVYIYIYDIYIYTYIYIWYIYIYSIYIIIYTQYEYLSPPNESPTGPGVSRTAFGTDAAKVPSPPSESSCANWSTGLTQPLH